MYGDADAPALLVQGLTAWHLLHGSARLSPGTDLGPTGRFLVAADPRHALIDALNIGFTSPGADRCSVPAAACCPPRRRS